MPYVVFVADNAHYMDKSAEYELGPFSTLEDALEAARKLVDDFLLSAARPGMDSETLLRNYSCFGEDPMVLSPDERRGTFWGSEYAKERCKEICAANTGPIDTRPSFLHHCHELESNVRAFATDPAEKTLGPLFARAALARLIEHLLYVSGSETATQIGSLESDVFELQDDRLPVSGKATLTRLSVSEEVPVRVTALFSESLERLDALECVLQETVVTWHRDEKPC